MPAMQEDLGITKGGFGIVPDTTWVAVWGFKVR